MPNISNGIDGFQLDKIELYVSDGNNFVVNEIVPPVFNFEINSNNFLHVGDFNGDGAKDILVLINSYANIYSPRNNNAVALINASYVTQSEKIKIFDIDGDGKDELMVTNNEQVNIYKTSSYEDGNVIVLNHLPNVVFPITNYDKIINGDFNGDSKTDFLLKNGFEWNIVYSTGMGFSLDSISFPYSLMSDDYVNVQDVNGDGLSDIVFAKKMKKK